MFIYPHLTASEQAGLPELVAQPIAIQNKFEDSTHHLFDCQTVEGEMVLKVCNEGAIANSLFWSAANHLFAADFPNSLAHIHFTHDFLKKHGALAVPDFVAAGAHRFVLTRFLAGQDIEARHITDQWVNQLADHIARLHQLTDTRWGKLHAPQFSAQAWASRLHDTLSFLANKNDTWVAHPLLAEVLAQAENIHETEFVPVMLDLRWDQFRYSQFGQSGTNGLGNHKLGNHGLALIDLDAFVIAPRALDLVLMQYVLPPAQLAVFKQRYVQTHRWPDHSFQKPCYQLLLFFMNVLGETDLAKWMQRV
ncbi:hypothetical protein [Methylophilus aquaticus]|uniref:Aminoglycoside phosphotransferase domain-containing protein n=1 Tax=Methylophilus aquaticus TaxID=1971610 RepID=A0ABT9JUU1_9PROT|nr:hypothetical protein [Methylophilus aquaticus]MDP8568338.1 hypothetical protein [Methylophilus aquaticus]